MKNNRRQFLFVIVQGLVFLGSAKASDTKLIDITQSQWGGVKPNFPSHIVTKARKAESRHKTIQLSETLFNFSGNSISTNIVTDFLHRQISLDYQTGEIAIIDGWIISLTEVSLIVLLYSHV
jgi:hypothetical protein